MASNAEPNIAPDGGGDPPPANEAVVSQNRYDLRPRQKLNEIYGPGAEHDPLETSEPGRRAGATVFIHGVDAMISPPHDGDACEPRRPRDWRAHHEPRKRWRASSGSSDAGSRFSSAHGSPSGRGEFPQPEPHAPAVSARAAIQNEHRGLRDTSSDDVPRRLPPATPRPKERGDELHALGKPHRHRSPPIFEDMSWAELEAYRKIHVAFQQQRLAAQTDRNRVHESAIRPNPSFLSDGKRQMDPLRAQTMSEVFGPPVARRPGRDEAKAASRADRRVSDSLQSLQGRAYKAKARGRKAKAKAKARGRKAKAKAKARGRKAKAKAKIFGLKAGLRPRPRPRPNIPAFN